MQKEEKCLPWKLSPLAKGEALTWENLRLSGLADQRELVLAIAFPGMVDQSGRTELF